MLYCVVYFLFDEFLFRLILKKNFLSPGILLDTHTHTHSHAHTHTHTYARTSRHSMYDIHTCKNHLTSFWAYGSNTVSIHIASTPRTRCVVCSVVQSTLDISCFFLLQNIYVSYHAPQTQLTTYFLTATTATSIPTKIIYLNFVAQYVPLNLFYF